MRLPTHLLPALAAFLLASSALAVTPVASFGPNPGNLAMYEHVPAGLVDPAPLVLVLHGCSQNAAYADASGWVALADARGFLLVIGETSSANNSGGCFNWFESADISGEGGEAESLRAMVESMKTRHAVDAERVFVTGVSAGAAMGAVLMATAPETFAAGSLFAGIAYRCGEGLFNAFACMNSGRTLSQTAWAALVEDETGHAGPWPRVQIWHGTDDTTVVPVNADMLALQWTGVHAIAGAPTTTTEGAVEVQQWSAAETPVVEVRRFTAMAHGTPIDPPACGTAGGFILDTDVCGAEVALTFFGLDDASPTDAGANDAGANDAGGPRPDGGELDAGAVLDDAGVIRVDGGDVDAGADVGPAAGCGCAATDPGPGALETIAFAGLLALVFPHTRRRRRSRSPSDI